ncbi:MAG TPA: phosphomannomutase/phosphoglucomutase, partial [Candidatus Nanoarchaeia archaeon]|nr:phosphomannomutase/phosphoglucomutase [Candidatus Nanoarchaeia archaeon]
MTIFKAYDIRGVYPTELHEDSVYKIARSFVLFLQKSNPSSSVSETIVIGQDMRTSSPQLADAIIKGLLSRDAHTIDIGLVATPTFYFEVANSKHRGGVMITASHNPKEYNGLKMVKENAINLSIEEMQWVKEHMDDNIDDKSTAGKGKSEVKHTSLSEQTKHDLTYLRKPIKKFRVVADAANSMGALTIRELFKHLPCKLIELNFELDGTFPAHPADPLADENLTALKQKVIAEKADIGIATDGDGDRIFFVDEKGETIPQPIMRGLIAQSFLKQSPGEKVCYDIRPGKVTEEMIRAAGGIPIKTKVGHTNIKETMRKENAIFAGESSGHFFVRTGHGSYEAPMIVFLKLLERMSEENRPLSDIIAPYKKYWNSGELNFHIRNKEEIMKKIEKHFHNGKIDKMDGISIEYKEFWFNVRASNTEPLLRLNLEAMNKEIGEERVAEIKKLIA